MRLCFGKHRGEALEVVFLRDPEYVRWILRLECRTTEWMTWARQESFRLVGIFDSKPLLRSCEGHGCTNPATRGGVVLGSVAPRWYCDDCDLYRLAGEPGRVRVLRSFQDAVNHVYYSCPCPESSLKALVRVMALAKGFPDQAGEREAVAFFV
jgi:hypothetical protein